jgi:hypothetical protein
MSDPIHFNYFARDIQIGLTDPDNTRFVPTSFNGVAERAHRCPKKYPNSVVSMSSDDGYGYGSAICNRGPWPFLWTNPGLGSVCGIDDDTPLPSYPLDMRAGRHYATFNFRSHCAGEGGDGPGAMVGIAGTDFAPYGISAECQRSHGTFNSPGVAHWHASGCMFDTGKGEWVGAGARFDWPGAPGAVTHADQGARSLALHDLLPLFLFLFAHSLTCSPSFLFPPPLPLTPCPRPAHPPRI